MKLKFLGAAETVTGSRFLLDTGRAKLLVDCGLFQGLKKLRQRNWAQFPVPPGDIHAVLLTHAHIDHSGYLPVLMKHGFAGRVYCTPATYDLCRILLPDAGHLQEEEAMYANRHGFSRHKPALPLFTEQDARRSLELFETVAFDSEFLPFEGVRARFIPNGHILGSSSVSVSAGGRRLTFSGDVGRPDDPVMPPPAPLPESDYLIIESTYGDRRHTRERPEDVIEAAINATAAAGGTILVPAFAVGRAQSILYLLYRLAEAGRIPDLPVFLDSPMAIDATEILYKYHELHRLSAEDCRAIFRMASFTRTVDESKAIYDHEGPKVIISASGMLTGGRILHHLKHYLPDGRNLVLFTGYQAAGTRGAAMLGGAEEVKIHGAYYPVKARTLMVDGISAHADYQELGEWLSALPRPPKKTLIVHGEPQSQDAFRRYLKDTLGWTAEIPAQGDQVTLED